MAKAVCCAHFTTQGIVANVFYPAVLLVYGWPLNLLPTMVGCLQSGLHILCQRCCNIVTEEDREGNVVVGPDGEPRIKTLNPHVECLIHTS